MSQLELPTLGQRILVQTEDPDPSDGTHEFEGVVVQLAGTLVVLMSVTHTSVPDPSWSSAEPMVFHREGPLFFELSDTDNVIWQPA
jgi:hypothetical protein